ncbi:MAG: hypothetical protein HYX69_20085 [Planctomycetia bacterium]|nr:hypothetical protein [Planctomycetia bacterium]
MNEEHRRWPSGDGMTASGGCGAEWWRGSSVSGLSIRAFCRQEDVPSRRSFTYDAVGNRIKGVGAGVDTYTYDAGNQSQKRQESGGFGTTTFTFDAAGNRIADRNTTLNFRTTFTWDAENRMTGMNFVAAGSLRMRYTHVYNGDTQRVERNQLSGVTGRRFIWDGQNVLMETDTGNTTQAVYTLDPQLYGNLVSMRQAATSYYHYDGLGSTERLTNASQTTTDTYSYPAFGSRGSPDKSSTTTNPYRWLGLIGYQTDGPRTVSGDPPLYVRARDYDYFTARWMSVDLIKTGDWNLYRYVANNPLALTDPSGLDQKKAPPKRAPTGCDSLFPFPLDEPNPFESKGAIDCILACTRAYDPKKGTPLKKDDPPTMAECIAKCVGDEREKKLREQGASWLAGYLCCTTRLPPNSRGGGLDPCKCGKKGPCCRPQGMKLEDLQREFKTQNQCNDCCDWRQCFDQIYNTLITLAKFKKEKGIPSTDDPATPWRNCLTTCLNSL